MGMYDVPQNEANDLWALRERAKELRCLYSVISALSRREEPPNVVFTWILEAIPPAWQYPEDTTARIEYFGRTHALSDFVDTAWRMRSPISIWRTQVGVVKVHYKRERPIAWEGPFLREEQELLDNIAHRIGEYLEWKQRELGSERLGAAPEHWRLASAVCRTYCGVHGPGKIWGRGGLPVRQHGAWQCWRRKRH